VIKRIFGLIAHICVFGGFEPCQVHPHAGVLDMARSLCR